MNEAVFCNAWLVLRDEVAQGSVKVANGTIVDVSTGPSAVGMDCDGDFLMPCLIELHTDNLERHLQPRPGVNWPRAAALQLGDMLGNLAQGMATVNRAPAVALGLSDRGQLAEGLRADMIRVRRAGAAVQLREVWISGKHVS